MVILQNKLLLPRYLNRLKKQPLLYQNAVKVSEDKKTHTITTTRDALNQGKTVVNCWKFDEKDPRGQYTIQVQVGEIVYAPLTFNVVK